MQKEPALWLNSAQLLERKMSVWHDFFHHSIQLCTPRIGKVRNSAGTQGLAPNSDGKVVSLSQIIGWSCQSTISSPGLVLERCVASLGGIPGNTSLIEWD